MRAHKAQEHSELIDVMLARRAQARMRLVLGAMIAGLFHPLTGVGAALVWFTLYLGLETFENFAYRPDRARRMLRGRTGRQTTLGYLAGRQLIFGAFGLLTALSRTEWGLAYAAMLICGALLNCVLTARGSRSVFLATVAPLTFYFIAIPFAAAMPPWQTAGVVVAGLMNLVTAVMVWLSASRALRAERHARHESDMRRAEAESAVAAKSAFVAVVSHELRTPISAILAGAGELEKSADAGARAKARLIADAGAMMRSLLNDLLDRAKLDAGRLAIETVGFDLRRLLADQMRFWRAEARKKGLRFVFVGARTTPRDVRGDPTRLRQILNNLISNALKFTDAGAVSIEVACGEAIGGGHAITIAVSDTGPGMTAEQLARLFTPFEQLDVSIARNHGGSGLGLAISRDLARLLGGDLTVRSAPGEGASFTVSLSFGRGVAAAPAPAAAAEPSREGLRVLVVDDHEINRRAMGMLLGPLGAEVTVAACAADALDILAERSFDVILMDCYMPGMDGKAATQVLRGSPGPNRSTPVIAVTASTSPQDVRACRAAGMNTHIAKPIDPAALYAALEEVLEVEDDEAAVA